MGKRDKREKQKARMGSAKKWADESGGGGGTTTLNLPEGWSGGFYQPKAGIRRLEVVPYTVGVGNPFCDEGLLYWERTYYAHPRIGANENSYICPAKTTGGKCPICDHRATLAQDPNADDDLVKSLRPKWRQLLFVVDHDEADKGVQLWDVSFYLFGQRLKKEMDAADEDENLETFFDPSEEGYTLKVGFEEKSFGGNKFVSGETVRPMRRKEPLRDEWLEQVFDLDAVLKIEPYEKLHGIFHQIEGPAEEPNDQTKPPKKDKKDKKDKKKKDKPPVDDVPF